MTDFAAFKPLRNRNNDVFLSHAHADLPAVTRLKDWLKQAGLNVWFDAERIDAGEQFPKAIAAGIGESQAMIVAVSKASRERPWIETELSTGLAHSRDYRGFPVIPVRLEECRLPDALYSLSAIDAFDGKLDGPESARLLRSIHALPDLSPTADVKTQVIQHLSKLAGEDVDEHQRVNVPVVYMTCGWRDGTNEVALRNRTRNYFSRAGFELVGDAVDFPTTETGRIKAIMRGCSAHLIVLPKRGTAKDISDREYKSIRAEIELAAELGLPQFCVVECGLNPPPGMQESLEIDLDTPKPWRDLEDWPDDLRRTMKGPAQPHFVFVATDYDDIAVKDHVVRHISQITGLPCLKGSDFGQENVAKQIRAAVRNATLVFSNIVSTPSETNTPNVNWNTCIEAGIAMGAGKKPHLLARRTPADTWVMLNLPFMIRESQTINEYADDQELMALVHRIARPFRRRILSGEAPS